ncbi:RNA polymerase sigma-70 factor [Pedobacter sp. HDW13]|uniref:RNA polymerase sigma-70 factor n=1 Tax=Pedobacter sp. HDW13 TaxID=2714940 RepID=UPI001409C87B|nr:RNA polymerase sigma-70 factor [Pedobacter sp. HDW13]QIL40362.1 RNA polymerase sigma-70 factor [Pedobacter sp. HDW13]
MAEMLPDDNELLVSFDEIFKLYYPRLCDFAARMLGDYTDEVEDVVQDTFVIFHKQMSQVSTHPIAVKNYLYTSVKYACFKKHRHNKIIRKYQETLKVDEPEQAFTLDAIIHAEIIGEIHRTLKTLPPGCAEVFKLGYFDELSNQEIAERLNISINTVKSQKKRALDLLRTKLKPEALALLLPFLLR